MGQVIKFECKARTRAEPPRAGGPARILLFTGIRYERKTDRRDTGTQAQHSRQRESR